MLVLGIDPGTASTGYGVVPRRRLAPARGRRGHDPDPPGRAARAAAGRHPPARRGAARRAPARGDGHRGAVLRRQRPHRVRGRPGARRGPAGRRPARRADARPTPRSRSRARSAPTAAPTRPRSRGWSRGCSAWPRRRRPTTPPTRWRWPSATSTTRRWRARWRGVSAMIALVSGKVAVRRGDHVVVDCGGVGYRLAVSAETLKHVPAVGRDVLLHTHLIVRDDALALYGFATEEERDLFLMLLGVQAVGPKVALAVLSGGAAARAARGRRRRRCGPAAGGARGRQAHGRADHRRAAREGGRDAARGLDHRHPLRRSARRSRARPCSAWATTPTRSMRCSTAPPATAPRS